MSCTNAIFTSPGFANGINRTTRCTPEPGEVEKVWKDLKVCFLEEAANVFEEARGIARQRETW